MTTVRLTAIVLLAATSIFASGNDPLIPRKDLFGADSLWNLKLSPSGKAISFLANAPDGSTQLKVAAMQPHPDLSLAVDVFSGPGQHSAHRAISDYWWAFDEKHLLFLGDTNGDEVFHLYSADVNSHRVRDLTPFENVIAQNVFLSARRKNAVLVGLNLSSPEVFDVYRVDIDSGAVELDSRNPGDVLSWSTDSDLDVRAATAFTSDGSSEIRFRDSRSGSWRTILRLPFDESPYLGQVNGGSLVVGISTDASSVYAGLYGTSNNTHLVEIDAHTGKQKRIVVQETDSDLWQVFASNFVVLTSPNGQIEAAAFNRTKPVWKTVNLDVGPDLEFLANQPYGFFSIVSQTQNDSKWIVRFEGDRQPPTYWLYVRSGKRLVRLLQDNPELAEGKLAAMAPFWIRSRDGLELLVYLSRPPQSQGRGPLLVVVHGGPWARDNWGFEDFVQLYANRGYSVLQVNYRGSDGLGKKYLAAGTGEIGGKAVDDIADAIDWAVGSGIADPNRIGILGASMGGLLAVRALERYPRTFKCGIDVFGPVDLSSTLTESFPPEWLPVKQRWIRRLGDVEQNASLNERLSPIFHIGDLQAPLLVIHGRHDRRVSLEQSTALVSALRKINVPVQLAIYEREGHGFDNGNDNLDFLQRTEAFLSQCLGGPAEPASELQGVDVTMH